VAYRFERLNIDWNGTGGTGVGDGGGFTRHDWRFVREVALGLSVQTVIEYGCGLSTELMDVLGLDVVSLETQQQFADIYLAAGYNVMQCDYDEGYPHLIGPYDLAFVDGPGEQERHDRSKSVAHAMDRSRLIYLHDYDLNQFEQLDAATTWRAATAYTERQSHLYYRPALLGPEKVKLLHFVLSERLQCPNIADDLLEDAGVAA